MPECETVNIKKLSVINEIKNGDFLLVENAEGSQILDFENFIVTEYNTTFWNTISSHTLSLTNDDINIKALSANQTSISGFWHPVLIGSSYSTDLYTLSGVSIGHSDPPWEKLTVVGNISAQGTLSVDCLSSTGTQDVYFANPVGIGTNTPGYILDVSSTTDTTHAMRLISTAADSDIKFRIQNDAQQYSLNVDGANGDKFHLRDEVANAARLSLTTEGRFGLGEVAPRSTLHVSTVSACVTVDAYTDTTEPGIPAESSQAAIYVKGSKLIVKYNDGGTTRYKHLPLSGTSIAWIHTENSEPDV